MIYDTIETVELEFPKEEWEWHRVSSGDEGTRVIASMAFLTGKTVLGQARWFSDNDGVILVKKSDLTVDNTLKSIEKSTKKPWYKRIFGL